MAGPKLRSRYKKLAQLRKTAQFVTQGALRSPAKAARKAGMLHAVWKANRSVRELGRLTVNAVSTGKAGKPKQPTMKVLLAVDGSVYSDAAVEEVAKRPWPSQSELKVITAAETPLMGGTEPWAPLPEYFEQLEQSVRDAAKAIIKSALLKLKTTEDQKLKISSEFIQGPPKHVIVEEAKSWGADLIVMGSRGLSTLNRLLLGSVSNSVVHRANCSVEIVRRPQAS